MVDYAGLATSGVIWAFQGLKHTVRQALGHKSIASTAVYAVPTDEMVGKAVNSALASLF
jgi:hypothetical protein